jgi:hypothetical protein
MKDPAGERAYIQIANDRAMSWFLICESELGFVCPSHHDEYHRTNRELADHMR